MSEHRRLSGHRNQAETGIRAALDDAVDDALGCVTEAGVVAAGVDLHGIHADARDRRRLKIAVIRGENPVSRSLIKMSS
jgi:hypothetical protein